VKLLSDILGSVVMLTVNSAGPKTKPSMVNQASYSKFYQLDKTCSTSCTVQWLTVNVAGEECEANSFFCYKL